MSVTIPNDALDIKVWATGVASGGVDEASFYVEVVMGVPYGVTSQDKLDAHLELLEKMIDDHVSASPHTGWSFNISVQWKVFGGDSYTYTP